MAYTPCGFRIPGPKFTPDRYGLLTVADPITPEDGHWEGGVTWDDELCSEIHSRTEDCPIPSEGFPPKDTDRSFQSCCADPFTVYSSYDCPPVGNTEDEAFSIAEKRLIIRENREVERVFWTGVAEDGSVVNPSLAFGNETCGSAPVNLTPPGGSVGVIASMAILESALGNCVPGTGVIHANYGLASFLTANFLITQKDDAWFTVTGQRLAIGAGYPGTGPGNIPADPGTTWVFATGPIVIARSEIFLTPDVYKESVDRSLNTVSIFAERIYSVGFSCCLFGIQVTLCP